MVYRPKRRNKSEEAAVEESVAICSPFIKADSPRIEADVNSYAPTTNTTGAEGSVDSQAFVSPRTEKEAMSPPARVAPPVPKCIWMTEDNITSMPEIAISEMEVDIAGCTDTSIYSSQLSDRSPHNQSPNTSLKPAVFRSSFTLTPPITVSRASIEDNTDNERRHAQAELLRLQKELAKAKSSGDKKSAQVALQNSIQLIQETFLSPTTSLERNKALPPSKPKTRRTSLFRLPSLATLVQMPSRAKVSQISAANEAFQSGSRAKLEELLDQGISVNTRTKETRTLLIQAAFHGQIGCLELLRERGADELAVDERGLNALHLAVLAQQPAVVRWLLETYSTSEQEATRIKSSKGHKISTGSILRPYRSLREASDREGFKPVHLAARHGFTNMVNILLDNGANPEAKCNRGGTPLHYAVISNHIRIVKTLLAKGVDVGVADAQGLTPLHYAASLNYVSSVEILLMAGSKRKIYDNAADMPIHLAARKGGLEAMAALTQEKADLKLKTFHGDSLLHIAVLMNQMHIVEYLLQNEVEVNPWSRSRPAKLDTNGKIVFATLGQPTESPSSTPLHSACFAGNYEMAAMLLDNSAWVNAATADGKTPLMLAVESDDTDLVYLLLARGAKVDAKIPGSLLAAQHICCQLGNLETLQILYQYGASLEAQTLATRRPINYAARCTDVAKREATLLWVWKVREKRAAQARALNAYELQAQPQYSHALTPSLNPY